MRCMRDVCNAKTITEDSDSTRMFWRRFCVFLESSLLMVRRKFAKKEPRVEQCRGFSCYSSSYVQKKDGSEVFAFFSCACLLLFVFVICVVGAPSSLLAKGSDGNSLNSEQSLFDLGSSSLGGNGFATVSAQTDKQQIISIGETLTIGGAGGINVVKSLDGSRSSAIQSKKPTSKGSYTINIEKPTVHNGAMVRSNNNDGAIVLLHQKNDANIDSIVVAEGAQIVNENYGNKNAIDKAYMHILPGAIFDQGSASIINNGLVQGPVGIYLGGDGSNTITNNVAGKIVGKRNQAFMFDQDPFFSFGMAYDELNNKANYTYNGTISQDDTVCNLTVNCLFGDSIGAAIVFSDGFSDKYANGKGAFSGPYRNNVINHGKIQLDPSDYKMVTINNSGTWPTNTENSGSAALGVVIAGSNMSIENYGSILTGNFNASIVNTVSGFKSAQLGMSSSIGIFGRGKLEVNNFKHSNIESYYGSAIVASQNLLIGKYSTFETNAYFHDKNYNHPSEALFSERETGYSADVKDPSVKITNIGIIQSHQAVSWSGTARRGYYKLPSKKYSLGYVLWGYGTIYSEHTALIDNYGTIKNSADIAALDNSVETTSHAYTTAINFWHVQSLAPVIFLGDGGMVNNYGTIINVVSDDSKTSKFYKQNYHKYVGPAIFIAPPTAETVKRDEHGVVDGGVIYNEGTIAGGYYGIAAAVPSADPNHDDYVGMVASFRLEVPSAGMPSFNHPRPGSFDLVAHGVNGMNLDITNEVGGVISGFHAIGFASNDKGTHSVMNMGAINSVDSDGNIQKGDLSCTGVACAVAIDFSRGSDKLSVVGSKASISGHVSFGAGIDTLTLKDIGPKSISSATFSGGDDPDKIVLLSNVPSGGSFAVNTDLFAGDFESLVSNMGVNGQASLYGNKYFQINTIDVQSGALMLGADNIGGNYVAAHVGDISYDAPLRVTVERGAQLLLAESSIIKGDVIIQKGGKFQYAKGSQIQGRLEAMEGADVESFITNNEGDRVPDPSAQLVVQSGNVNFTDGSVLHVVFGQSAEWDAKSGTYVNKGGTVINNTLLISDRASAVIEGNAKIAIDRLPLNAILSGIEGGETYTIHGTVVNTENGGSVRMMEGNPHASEYYFINVGVCGSLDSKTCAGSARKSKSDSVNSGSNATNGTDITSIIVNVGMKDNENIFAPADVLSELNEGERNAVYTFSDVFQTLVADNPEGPGVDYLNNLLSLQKGDPTTLADVLSTLTAEIYGTSLSHATWSFKKSQETLYQHIYRTPSSCAIGQKCVWFNMNTTGETTSSALDQAKGFHRTSSRDYVGHLGIDHRLNGSSIIGGALNFGRSKVSVLDGHQSSTFYSLGGVGYATYGSYAQHNFFDYTPSLYATGMAGVEYNFGTAKRYGVLSGDEEKQLDMNAYHKGALKFFQTSISGEIGYDNMMRLNVLGATTTITPFTRVNLGLAKARGLDESLYNAPSDYSPTNDLDLSTYKIHAFKKYTFDFIAGVRNRFAQEIDSLNSVFSLTSEVSLKMDLRHKMINMNAHVVTDKDLGLVSAVRPVYELDVNVGGVFEANSGWKTSASVDFGFSKHYRNYAFSFGMAKNF